MPLFREPRFIKLFLQALDAAPFAADFELFAFVVMPEHCHVLLYPKNEEYDMGEILKAIKSPTAKAIFAAEPALRPTFAINRSRRPIEYRLWQKGGGYDRNVTRVSTIWNVIRYIHANPVRRGLRTFPSEWPWSSAAAYEGKKAAIPVNLCTWSDDLAKPRM